MLNPDGAHPATGMDFPKDPSGKRFVDIELLDNLETAKMTLRWMLERVKSLENREAELLSKLERELRRHSDLEKAYANRREALDHEYERFRSDIEEELRLRIDGLEERISQELLQRRKLETAQRSLASERDGLAQRLDAISKANPATPGGSIDAQAALAALSAERDRLVRERDKLAADATSYRAELERQFPRLLDMESRLEEADARARAECATIEQRLAAERQNSTRLAQAVRELQARLRETESALSQRKESAANSQARLEKEMAKLATLARSQDELNLALRQALGRLDETRREAEAWKAKAHALRADQTRSLEQLRMEKLEVSEREAQLQDATRALVSEYRQKQDELRRLMDEAIAKLARASEG